MRAHLSPALQTNFIPKVDAQKCKYTRRIGTHAFESGLMNKCCQCVTSFIGAQQKGRLGGAITETAKTFAPEGEHHFPHTSLDAAQSAS